MMMLWLLLAPSNGLLLGAPAHAVASRSSVGQLRMQGAAPAKPKTRTRQVTRGPDSGDGKGKGGPAASVAKPKLKRNTEDIPLWNVFLLGDEEYEQDPVCEVLLNIVPDIANLRQAAEKYEEAEKTGKALLITVPKELGEAYVEQLIRADPMVYAEIKQE